MPELNLCIFNLSSGMWSKHFRNFRLSHVQLYVQKQVNQDSNYRWIIQYDADLNYVENTLVTVCRIYHSMYTMALCAVKSRFWHRGHNPQNITAKNFPQRFKIIANFKRHDATRFVIKPAATCVKAAQGYTITAKSDSPLAQNQELY